MNKIIKTSWKPILESEFEKNYFKEIEHFVANQAAQGKTIFPKEEDVFSIFNAVDFEDVKVIVLGQDPYHGDKQAHGLSFSVPVGTKIPPSLRNIYKELASDVGFSIPNHGNLQSWANQGIFLLNAVLTVNANEAASHKNAGWEHFTDAIISKLSQEREHLVFLLWGSFALKKSSLIDQSKHLILSTVHPSPLSAHRGFLGCKHFSATNSYLTQKEKVPINWQIEDKNLQPLLF